MGHHYYHCISSSSKSAAAAAAEMPFGRDTYVVSSNNVLGPRSHMGRGDLGQICGGGSEPQFAAMPHSAKLLWPLLLLLLSLLYRPTDTLQLPTCPLYRFLSNISVNSSSISTKFTGIVVCQKHVSVNFLSFLAQAVSEHGAAATFLSLCASPGVANPSTTSH